MSPKHDFALSVSADHQVVKYDLSVRLPALARPHESSFAETRLLLSRSISRRFRHHPLQKSSRSSSSGTLASRSTTQDAFVRSEDGMGGSSSSPLSLLPLDFELTSCFLFFSVRLFSTKSFKPLGTLPYHRDTCHVLAFANSPAPPTSSSSPTEREEEEESDDDEEDEAGLVRGRDRWLATGGTDARVAVWELIDFESKSKGS